MPTSQRVALRVQAAYYLATGVWPLAHRRSFEAVTGPKTDWWLVQMVGLLAAANGAALAAGSCRKKISRETLALSLLSAASFAAIDVAYVTKHRIRPIYLGDAIVEAVLAAVIARRR